MRLQAWLANPERAKPQARGSEVGQMVKAERSWPGWDPTTCKSRIGGASLRVVSGWGEPGH